MAHIYVAGPYSQGNLDVNIKEAIEAADIILNHGHVPYVPHLTHLWELVSHHSYEEWMALDEKWLAKCDVMYRIDGMSSGADREEEFARKNNIPVFRSYYEMFRYLEKING